MSALPATIQPLPAGLTIDDPNGTTAATDYLAVIRNAIINHPRSLQRRIGPSELGHTCARRIGYKLLDVDENPVTDQDIPWLPTIGTGVHGWLEEAFIAANPGDPARQAEATRWLTEMTVAVGEVGGVEITGSMDLFDRVTGTVIDHKIVGPSTLRKYKANGPGDQYEGQIMLYGRGARRRGLTVNRVMIAFLPRNSELRDAYLWSAPYDEAKADAVLQRAQGIALTTQALGMDALTHLATADAYCNRCPFYKQGSTDLAAGCPGDPNRTAHTAAHPFADLIGG